MKEFSTKFGKIPGNGVRYLIIDIPSSEMTATHVSVKSGSINDAKPGEHHMDEHSRFKGTVHYTEQELNRRFDSLPAVWSAYTDKLRVVYHSEGPNRVTSNALDMIGEVIINPTYPPDKTDMEKNTINDEIDMYEDSPTSTVLEKWEKLLYNGNSIGEPILGTKQTVASITRDDIERLHHKYYCGSNLLITVAGNSQNVEESIARSFGMAPSGDKQGYTGSSGYGTPDVLFVDKDTSQAHFVFGFPGFSMDNPKYYALKIIQAILGGHSITDLGLSVASGRLYEKFRVSHNLTYEISTLVQTDTETGYLAIQGQVQPENVPTVLQMLKTELARLPLSISSEEVERAKGFWETYYLKKTEGVFDIADLMSQPALILDTVLQPTEILDSIETTTTREVQQVAQELLYDEQARLAILGPSTIDASQVKNIFNSKY